MKRKEKNKSGISLIVLVITIIVIIILAVAVILSISNNNPIESARKARFQNDLRTIQEEISLYIVKQYADHNGEYITNDSDLKTLIPESYKEKVTIRNGKVILVEDIVSEQEKEWAKEIGIKSAEKSEIEVGVKAEGSSKKYVDVDGDKAIIPVNFAIVPGCDNVSEGLVISDVENDTTDAGNQFVWVPVEDFSTFQREDGYEDGELQTKVSSGMATEPLNYGDLKATQSEIDEHKAMRDSVEHYKGFYIGRYEASNNGSGIAQSKRGKRSWYGINWAGDPSDLSGGAVEKSRAVYQDSTSKSSGEAVSTLCYGVQWDATVRWLKNNYSKIAEDSSGFGNYVPSNKINTGSNEDYKTNNIYDMCGNYNEWTMEAYSSDYQRILRGGRSGWGTGAKLPISVRLNASQTLSNFDIGFRLALYIKK